MKHIYQSQCPLYESMPTDLSVNDMFSEYPVVLPVFSISSQENLVHSLSSHYSTKTSFSPLLLITSISPLGRRPSFFYC